MMRRLPVSALLLSLQLLFATPATLAAELPFKFMLPKNTAQFVYYEFNHPFALAIDGQGCVYVSDSGHNAIQKFDPNGRLLTHFGMEGAVAVDNQGHVYVGDKMHDCIVKYTSDGSYLTQWSCGSASGIAVDGQRQFLYVVDGNEARVQKFTTDGVFLTQWGGVGYGDGQFDTPVSAAVDVDGNVYVVDASFYLHNPRIQKFTSDGSFLTKWGTYSGPFPNPGDGTFSYPSGVAVDHDGYVYVADTGNNRIQKFTTDGIFLTKWGGEWGGWGVDNGKLRMPEDLKADSQGNVWVTDYINNRLQKFSPDGAFLAAWGTHGSGDGEFFYLGDVAVDGQGQIYARDRTQLYYNSRIQKFDAHGNYLTQWGNSGSADEQLHGSGTLAVDGQGNVFVNDSRQSGDTTVACIKKFDTNGRFLTSFDAAGGLAVDGQGQVYVLDTGIGRIQKFDSGGVYLLEWEVPPGAGPNYVLAGLAADGQGNVYVTDYSYDTDSNGHQVLTQCRVQKFNSGGKFLTQWGGVGSGPGQFQGPGKVGVDGRGHVYVSDSGNGRIQEFTADGTFLTVLDNPRGLSAVGGGTLCVLYAGEYGWYGRIMVYAIPGAIPRGITPLLELLLD